MWDIDGAGDPSIQGFAADSSVNLASSISFKIKTSANYTITIFRLGYYQGLGARQIATVTPTARTQPACLEDAATGLYDCGNWAVSATWTVPATAVSGVYIALLHRTDTGGESHIPFVVRDDSSHSDIVMQTSDTTWQAYNTYGGSSFYQGGPTDRAYKISYNRPYLTRNGATKRDWLFSNEYPTIRFLESNGYDVSYMSGVDTDRRGSLIQNHKIFLSVGHDEYWSGAARSNVEAARDTGVNLAFFSGNEVYWRTRWESSIDGSSTNFRTLVSYKETRSDAKIDPSSQWTGTWRDPRFTPPAVGGGDPENGLTGTQYMVNDIDMPINVPAQQGRNRFWRNTSVASAAAGGGSSSAAPHSVGYESNEDVDNGFRPAGLIRLSTSTSSTTEYLYDFGKTVAPGTTTHHMTLYRAASGALVFSAGSVQYGWALDDYHDGTSTSPDPAIRQATINLFADMGVQPLTLESALTSGTKSTDLTGPTTAITTPSQGQTLNNGTQLTVSGTASDAGGGVVAGVEVSLDGGETWHPATGTTAWSYAGIISGSGTVAIQARATDDSANIGPSASRNVAVACPCSIFGQNVPKTPSVADSSAVELGIRFASESDGFVTGVRFYKAAANTGTHTGSLWSASGTRLATGTFTGEGATGWQTLTFASPVAVTAATTYVASYTAPSGRYAGDPWSFSYRDTTTSPVKALRSTASAGNGVYGSPGSFPSGSYESTNYWVDVTFSAAASTAPAVVSTSPESNVTGASTTAPLSATFNVPISPNTATFSVTGPGGAVAGTTSLDSSSKVLTFTPASALAVGTQYNATVAGAESTGGGSMNSPYSWGFTTGGACPCSVFAGSAVPTTADAGDGAAVELGMRFTPSSNGTVTGVRFYKAAANTGTHTGSLWTAGGVQLATGTFAGESASGWQTLTFASPVAVTAGATYVVSYYAPNGHYPADGGYFTTDVTNGPLTAPGTTNGVYRYGTGGGFPTGTWNASNYWVDLTFTAAPPDTTAPVVSAVSAAPGETSATVTWTTDEASTSVVAYGTSASSLTGSASASGTTTSHTMTLTGLTAGTTYYYRVTSADGSGNSTTSPASGSAPASFTTTTPGACPCSVFAGSAVPTTVDAGDGAAVELGMRFIPSVNGSVTGVRFYKAAANTGTHTGSLWSASGTRLATGTFTGESASGWQSLTFASPVAVTAGTTYVVSYYAPNGHYSADGGYFTTDITRGPLSAPGTTNGVYRYGTGDWFPTSSWNAANYWVDITFDAAPPDETAPVVSAVGAAPGETSTTVTWTTDEASTSVVAYGTSASSLTGSASASGTTTSHTVTLTGLTEGTTYYFRVTSADAAGNSTTSPANGSAPASFTTRTAGACPCSVFDGSAVPTTVDAGDGAAVELGMRFIPSVNGSVTGVRFYKAAANTGTHTGSLWSASGTRLATGTFTGESASGWQTLTFGAPVAVTAGTTYVASYYAPNGHYAADGGYFTTDITRGPLTAPGSNNGLYRYGTGGGFPTGTWNASNYWVDLTFAPDTTAPVVSAVSAAPGETSATVTWTTDEASTSVVAYGTSASSLTGSASASGTTTSHTMTLTGLTAGTTYYYRVTSADGSGNSTTSPASGSAPASFTTTTPGACPCSVFAGSAVPTTADAGDGAAVELGMRFTPSSNGTVTGVRFYKAAANTGTHTGSLWTAGGVQLATGTFAGESASGWQTLTFASPVAVTAGATYVVSYYAPNGHYPADGGYFTTDVTNGPLTAPGTTNGVYRYGTGGGFPTGTWNASNYWVDLTFTPTP